MKKIKDVLSRAGEERDVRLDGGNSNLTDVE
jgi:hypothetical protein